MNYSWDAIARCVECGLSFSNIEPELILRSDEVGRYWIICPGCLKMKPVSYAATKMKKRMLEIDFMTSSDEILQKLYKMKKEEKNFNAMAILDAIKKCRVQMGLDPLKFE